MTIADPYSASPANALPRIGVVLLTSSLEYGGTERQVVELARNLDVQRFDPLVVSLSHDVPLANLLSDPDRDLVVVEKKSKYDLSTVPRLARVMRRHHASIVHAFHFDANIAGRLAGALARVPVVLISERNTDYQRPRLQQIALRLTNGLSDGVIANSNTGRRFTINTLKLPAETVHAIHNGVDVERFSPLPADEARRRLEITHRGPLVGMIASFKPQKNHRMFLEAARRVAERFADVHFLCVGARLVAGGAFKAGSGYHGDVDAYYRSVLASIEAMGLTDRCTILTGVGDMPAVYSACDFTVLPSRHEGTPNVLLESMACRVPVIATDVADNAYVAPDGEVGFIVPLDDVDALTDRMVRLLADADLRGRMRDAARAWVQREFSTTALARKTEAIYLELLRRKAPRRGRVVCAS